MFKPCVYIAGKLTDTAPNYIKNMNKMIHWARALRQYGFAVYVPCLDFLEGLVDGAFDYNDYFENSQEWLQRADALFVCPGYESSQGTLKEIAIAEKSFIPIFFDVSDLCRAFGLMTNVEAF